MKEGNVLEQLPFNGCKKVCNFVKTQNSTLYFLYDYTPYPIFA